MIREKFDVWFARYLGALPGLDTGQVATLLRDKTATRFLIAWSLLETSCFHGFAKCDSIASLAKSKASNEPQLAYELNDHVRFFHSRYQDQRIYKNLMHGQKSERMEAILKTPLEALTAEDQFFLSLLVVYRYRNNIFHGNKGVASWLHYRDNIQRCIDIMQSFIPMPDAEADQAFASMASVA